MGSIKFNLEWDWSGAERAFRRAIEINPNAAVAHLNYALLLKNLGRFDEAIKQDEEAREADPLWLAPHQSLGYLSFLQGRYDDSFAHHEAALQLEPNAPHSHVTAGFLTLRVGRHDEALDHFRRAVATSGGTSFFSACLAYACAVTGRRSEAETIVREIEERGKTRYISRASLCWAYIGLDNINEALQCLQMAYEQHDSMLVCMPSFTWWDPIRETDLFRDISARMNFPVPVRKAGSLADAYATKRAALPAKAKTTGDLKTQSLAVLPLENLARDPAEEYFADRITDALITALASLSGLRVISRRSSMRFKGVDTSLADIAAALNVNTILAGTVFRVGTRVRITVRLVDPMTDANLWSSSYEDEVTDVLALQGRVARAVAQELQVQLTHDESERLVKSRPVNPETYAAYLRGRHYFLGFTAERVQQAIALRGHPRFEALLPKSGIRQ